jgi:hypothetical protein
VGEQQAQVVVDLGDRAHRGAGVLRGGLLLDRDRRREPLDRLHVWLLHELQELAGIGGEAFHIAPLALGIDGIEGQRGLAGAGQARDHHQPVARQLHVDVLQVVLAGAPDRDLGAGAGVGEAGIHGWGGSLSDQEERITIWR